MATPKRISIAGSCQQCLWRGLTTHYDGQGLAIDQATAWDGKAVPDWLEGERSGGLL